MFMALALQEVVSVRVMRVHGTNPHLKQIMKAGCRQDCAGCLLARSIALSTAGTLVYTSFWRYEFVETHTLSSSRHPEVLPGLFGRGASKGDGPGGATAGARCTGAGRSSFEAREGARSSETVNLSCLVQRV
jgi:hypothetical protein